MDILPCDADLPYLLFGAAALLGDLAQLDADARNRFAVGFNLLLQLLGADLEFRNSLTPLGRVFLQFTGLLLVALTLRIGVVKLAIYLLGLGRKNRLLTAKRFDL